MYPKFNDNFMISRSITLLLASLKESQKHVNQNKLLKYLNPKALNKNGNVTKSQPYTTMSSIITTVHIFGSPKMDININIGWYQDLDQQKTFLFLHLFFPLVRNSYQIISILKSDLKGTGKTKGE